jgi:hypothetical protein
MQFERHLPVIRLRNNLQQRSPNCSSIGRAFMLFSTASWPVHHGQNKIFSALALADNSVPTHPTPSAALTPRKFCF